MRIIRSIEEMQNYSTDLHRAGKTTGFVPTMGALHDGHLSLLKHIRSKVNSAIMSIFVNPTQFGPKEDLARYPRPFEKDCALAERNGCDILFSPSSDEMYPEGFSSYLTVENLSTTLEGEIRPGHFKGVATVVLKLFNIVSPDIAVFGQKDVQQAIILKRMVKDLNLRINLLVLPTFRESDGLAMSSRNSYLTPEERKDAPLIYQALRKAHDNYNRGELLSQKLSEQIQSVFKSAHFFRPEYIEVVNSYTLAPVELVSNKTLLAVACRTTQSNTRLIDNVILGFGVF
jgi:pantoate--beta-alanine ligase